MQKEINTRQSPDMIDTILKDKRSLKKHLSKLNICVPITQIVSDKNEALQIIKKIGLPVDVKSLYPISSYQEEKIADASFCEEIVERMLLISRTKEIELQKDFKTDKCIEMQFLSDRLGNSIVIGEQETIWKNDTETFKITPVQTLESFTYQQMRNDAKKVIESLSIIGISNFIFYISRKTNQYLLADIENDKENIKKQNITIPKEKLEKIINQLEKGITFFEKYLMSESRYRQMTVMMEKENKEIKMQKGDIKSIFQRQFFTEESIPKIQYFENKRIDELTQALQEIRQDIIYGIIAGLYKKMDVQRLSELTNIDKYYIQLLEDIIRDLIDSKQ